MNTAALARLVDRYTTDLESVYTTWFLSSAARMKAFRAIQRGVRDTVDSIAAGTFGNDFKGSPLEVVLTASFKKGMIACLGYFISAWR